ncbi:MAG TPA: MarR family transcriptional regulator, partial [Polyangiales bacterium]|nr:MarR family transcriptional regulator [Polyangiales bacterium]
AELTGLSTGAITGVIDRLERAGFLVREHDPEDRRRVLLRLTLTREPEMHALFAPLAKGVEALCENYTIAELAVVIRFMREIRLVTDEIADQLRSGAVGAAAAGPPQPTGSDASDLVEPDPAAVAAVVATKRKSAGGARRARAVSKAALAATQRAVEIAASATAAAKRAAAAKSERAK